MSLNLEKNARKILGIKIIKSNPSYIYLKTRSSVKKLSNKIDSIPNILVLAQFQPSKLP